MIGSDFCFEMLEVGRQKSSKTNRDVTFIEADAQNLPFEDNQFQVVSAAFGLRNVASTDQGLKEMTRVCKPGGQVAILEFFGPHGTSQSKECTGGTLRMFCHESGNSWREMIQVLIVTYLTASVSFPVTKN